MSWKHIRILDTDGVIKHIASYSPALTEKQALVNFIIQYMKHDFNTWDYPKEIDGMWKVQDRWYWADDNDNIYTCITCEEE